jgi:hypothetical protein
MPFVRFFIGNLLGADARRLLSALFVPDHSKPRTKQVQWDDLQYQNLLQV